MSRRTFLRDCSVLLGSSLSFIAGSLIADGCSLSTSMSGKGSTAGAGGASATREGAAEATMNAELSELTEGLAAAFLRTIG